MPALPLHQHRHFFLRRTVCSSLLVLLLLCPISTTGFPFPRFLSLPSGPVLMAAAASSAAGSSEGVRDIGGSSAATPISAATPSTAAISSTSPHQWVQALEASLEKNKADMHSRFMQLATIGRPDATTEEDEEGGTFLRPHVRWIVFRGFLYDNTNTTTLKTIIDSRSEKVRDIQSNPFGELSWYFVQSREQFRLAGRCQLVMADESDAALAAARQAQWAAMSDNARLQFIWPTPGDSQEGDGVTEEGRKALFNPPPPSATSSPPETFVLLLFHPSRVDHLQLRSNPQVRTIHDKQRRSKGRVGAKGEEGECVAVDGNEKEEWAARRVNP